MASVVVAHTLNAHSTVFLFGFEAPKSSLDGLNAQLPLFMSIYNQDVIWNGLKCFYRNIPTPGTYGLAFPGHMHVDSDEEVWGF